MRVISKFHDYYDVIQAHGADDGLLMLRETVVHAADKEPAFRPLIEHFNSIISCRTWNDAHVYSRTRTWSHLTIRAFVVLFVGKPYVGFFVSRSLLAMPYTKDQRYVYSLDELDALLIEHGAKSLYDRTKVRKWNSWIQINKSWPLQTYEYGISKSFEAKAAELQAPIILFDHRDRCTTYPSLKELQFYKLMQPWQVYQELSMFLGNIAAPDRVPVTIADKDRVNQHGFDMKYGFRTRPKG